MHPEIKVQRCAKDLSNILVFECFCVTSVGDQNKEHWTEKLYSISIFETIGASFRTNGI